MQLHTLQLSNPLTSSLVLQLATSPADIEAAQRLRYQVFAEEMGARIPDHGQGLDRDIFDSYCDHLLVRDESTGMVVGTYRILPPEQAVAAGSYYSENEFDLTRLLHIRPYTVELGRSCVHPDYRHGGTITMLWAGLAHYMRERGYDYLIGCASMGMADGGHAAASVYQRLSQSAMAPIEWRVTPRCRLPLEALNHQVEADVPPLIKGYLRVGAKICGEPAWDPDFNTADMLLLLPFAAMNPRYLRHFFGAGL